MNINEFYKFIIKELRNITNMKPHYNSKNVYFLRFHRISNTFLYRPYFDNHKAWQRISGYQATGTAIQNPFTFYYANNYDRSSTHSYLFWNKNFTTAVGANNEETIKTIYSPSLSGYVEPKTAAFTGFTSTGGYTNNGGQFNITGVWNKGWLFYTNGCKSGNTIFFSAAGYRNTYNSGNGTVMNVGKAGRFWSAGVSSTVGGHHLYFNSGYVYPQNANNRSVGASVRSVKN